MRQCNDGEPKMSTKGPLCKKTIFLCWSIFILVYGILTSSVCSCCLGSEAGHWHRILECVLVGQGADDLGQKANDLGHRAYAVGQGSDDLEQQQMI